MTTRAEHDQAEAEARHAALNAATTARHAADTYDSGRISEAMELIRYAAKNADLATRQAWPFLGQA